MIRWQLYAHGTWGEATQSFKVFVIYIHQCVSHMQAQISNMKKILNKYSVRTRILRQVCKYRRYHDYQKCELSLFSRSELLLATCECKTIMSPLTLRAAHRIHIARMPTRQLLPTCHHIKQILDDHASQWCSRTRQRADIIPNLFGSS